MSIFRTRRSIKPAAMDPMRPVSRADVEAVLADAQWAPSHGLTQPWRFHVFSGPQSRASLGDALQSIYDQITPEPKRDADKRAKLGAQPRRAPVVIVLVAAFVPGGKVPEWEELAAASCAAQNLMLSAHERGLATFWSSPPAACDAGFVRWLGLDAATHRGLGLIYLGWPLAGQAVPSSVREPLSACTTWHES